MSAQWQQSSQDTLERAKQALAELWQSLAQPARARRIRQGLVVALLVWAVAALAQLFWAVFPVADPPERAQGEILNPVEGRAASAAAPPVDIDKMLSWHLFGVAGALEAKATQAIEPVQNTGREGIEDGARQTRLDLKLRGVVSATDDGLGHAVIEFRSTQQIYAVGDKLPVGNQVVLAKVLAREVVLDNGGTYELLRLYEDNGLLEQLPPPAERSNIPVRPVQEVRNEPAQLPEETEPSSVARSLREQMYSNPQTLAEVVKVSAVRENQALLGYRIEPGKNSQQFTQLGFEPGDVVTSVNGVSLDSPGNAMQLYQLMRTASEAVFDLERGGETLTLTVSLEDSPGDG